MAQLFQDGPHCWGVADAPRGHGCRVSGHSALSGRTILRLPSGRAPTPGSWILPFGAIGRTGVGALRWVRLARLSGIVVRTQNGPRTSRGDRRPRARVQATASSVIALGPVLPLPAQPFGGRAGFAHRRPGHQVESPVFRTFSVPQQLRPPDPRPQPGPAKRRSALRTPFRQARNIRR